MNVFNFQNGSDNYLHIKVKYQRGGFQRYFAGKSSEADFSSGLHFIKGSSGIPRGTLLYDEPLFLLSKWNCKDFLCVC